MNLQSAACSHAETKSNRITADSVRQQQAMKQSHVGVVRAGKNGWQGAPHPEEWKGGQGGVRGGKGRGDQGVSCTCRQDAGGCKDTHDPTWASTATASRRSLISGMTRCGKMRLAGSSQAASTTWARSSSNTAHASSRCCTISLCWVCSDLSKAACLSALHSLP